MKNGWPTKTLGEVCAFVRGPFGGSLKKSVFVEDGFAVYEQQHAIYDQFDDIRYFIDDTKSREMRRFEVRPNDLIMSCSGTMGRVAIVPENIQQGIINQALLKLTPSSAVSPQFLKYWMDSNDFQDSLKEQSGGAAIQNVASVGILKQIQISLPPRAEQQRIVGIIDEAFEGIAKARANAEKNLQNARALFESHLQSVFRQRGQGWTERPLGEVCDLLNGFAFKSEDAVQESQTRLVRMGNLYGNRLSLDRSPVFYPDSFAADYRRYLLSEGDLIMSLTGTTGKEDYGYAVRIPDCSQALLMNQRIVKFDSLKKELVDKVFLFYYLRSRAFLDILSDSKWNTAGKPIERNHKDVADPALLG
jgi:type I restriction enzyme, S subunit